MRTDLTRTAVLAAVTLATGVARSQEGRAVVVEAARVVIAPGTVLEGDDARVAFRDGKVLAVGREIPNELLERSKHVRYAEATVVPGFVVAHDYLSLGNDLAETIDAFTPSLHTADAFDPFDEALPRFARGGVTTIGLAPLSKNTFAGIAAAVTFDGKTGHVMTDDAYLKLALVRESLDQQRYPTSRMGAADFVRTQFADARNPLVAPDAAHTVLREVLDGNRKLAVHARTRGEIITALELCGELGVQPILLGATEADECLDRLRGSGVSVVLGALDYDAKQQVLALPATLAGAGVPFSFAAGDPRALRRTLALAVHHGLAPDAALAAVTRTPAVQLGVADHAGTLLVGRDADLAVFDGDPTDLTSRVVAVWCYGTAIVEPETTAVEAKR